jgi:hypothetical protein
MAQELAQHLVHHHLSIVELEIEGLFWGGKQKEEGQVVLRLPGVG